jgi:hypothetical protein
MALTIYGFGDSSHGSMRMAAMGSGLNVEVFDITSADLSASNTLPSTFTRFFAGSAQYDTTTADATVSRGVASLMTFCSGYYEISIGDLTAGASGDRHLRVVGYGF